MMRLPKLSLRFKFIVPLVVFTIFLTVTVSYIAADRFYAELENQFDNRAREFTSELFRRYWQGAANRDLLSNDFETFKYQVVKDGGAIHTVDIPLEAEAILPMPVEPYRRPTTIDGRPYLEIVRLPDPFWISEESASKANYVKVFISMEGLYESQREAVTSIAIFGLISVLFGTIIIIWLFRGILGPIENLTKSVKQFKHDMQVRSDIKTGDELETLGYEFNRMANTIQERDEHLEEVNTELMKANEVKSEFLAVMGHELKTPIHGIRGYAQLMLEEIDGPITDAQRKDLENIMESGDHLRVLIDNILQFSKLESGKEKIHAHEVDIEEIIDDAMKNVSVIARQKGIELNSNVHGVRINADETKLKQVLINLLGNALKYTDEGSVTVSINELPGEIVFSVSDTGVGISQEDYEKVFEPFTQIDSSTTRKWGGIGLGLSIVKKYIEMHGGRIWVESEVGVGTTFHFTIPTVMELSEVQN